MTDIEKHISDQSLVDRGPRSRQTASYASRTASGTSTTCPSEAAVSAKVEPDSEKWTSDSIIIHGWDGPDDPENPFNWSSGYKWVVTITVCFISILTGIPAGSFGAAATDISSLYSIQTTPFDNTIWATVSWNIGACVWPLIFVPLSEATGRMPGYFGAYAVFIVFLFGSAFAQNFATFIVTRFFGGGGYSVTINIIVGSIADMWKGEAQRSLPVSLFSYTSVAGIALGPFVGSVILQIQRIDPWRWIFYIQIIYNTAFLIIFWFILQETRHDVILAKRASKLRKSTGQPIYAQSEINKPSIMSLIYISCCRPLKMLFTEPVCASFTLWVSFAWGILFVSFSSVVQTFQTSYDFTVLQTGLVQIAIPIGATIGAAVNPIQDKLYLKSARRNTEHPGKPIPEARLYFAVPGSLLFTAGLFWHGWTCRPEIPWIVPACGLACASIGIYSIYIGVVSYLTDSYEKYASSAMSAASLGSNFFGAFLPFASQPMYNNLGFGWAGSVLGFIGLALSFVPVVLLWKGPAIRARSPFMREAKFDDSDEDESG